MVLPLAVLIDAENISSDLHEPLREKVAALGDAISWQLFGDFLSHPHVGWQQIAEGNSIKIEHQFHGGKNSADIAMTIAAMDAMHAGIVEGICLVSSDSDFAPVAQRLRAARLSVFGFGEAKTGARFRRACTGFHELKAPPAVERNAAQLRGLDQMDVRRLHELLNSACQELGTDGKLLIASAASYIKKRAPDLSARVGGTGKFLKSLKALELVDLHEEGPQRLISVKFSKLAIVGR